MKIINVILLGSLLAIISACANNTSHANKYNLEVVKQSDVRWIFRHLVTSSGKTGTRVSGRMTAGERLALPHGHIDVAAYSPLGELISKTTTDYTPSILTRKYRRKGGVHFAAEFDVMLPANSVIKVAFHRDVIERKANPIHQENIAR